MSLADSLLEKREAFWWKLGKVMEILYRTLVQTNYSNKESKYDQQ